MGEYADDLIDAIMDDPTAYYGTRQLGSRRYKVSLPTCRFCGKTNLIWQEIEHGKYALFEMASTDIFDLELHTCRIKDRFKKHARL